MMDHLSLVPYEGAGGGGGGGGDLGGSRYKECMRNHAAAMGGQAFDGCGEYMPSSPDSLKCAACGCHRSFHRRAAAGPQGAFSSSSCAAAPVFFRPPPPPPLLAAPPPPPQHHQAYHHQAALQAFLPPVAPPPHLALPYHAVPGPWLARAGSETPPRAEDLQGSGGSGGGGVGFGRKRFRTKFTQEQKERMREFAERQGWRIQRNDDGALDRFCDEIGVKRQVLKVWMHNHKNQLASPPASAMPAAGVANPIASGAANAGAGAGAGGTGSHGHGHGHGGTGSHGHGGHGRDGSDDDDDDTDDSPPRAAVSSPSPSPISV